MKIPCLTQNSLPMISRVGNIISRSSTPDIRRRAKLHPQHALNIFQRVAGRIARHNPSTRKPVISWQSLIKLDSSLEIINDILILDVFRPVAFSAECTVAGTMFRELVGPEFGGTGALIDPILVHVFQQVESAETFDECVYAWTCVDWDCH